MGYCGYLEESAPVEGENIPLGRSKVLDADPHAMFIEKEGWIRDVSDTRLRQG